MKISEASQASGCHLETIRYYERIGLMPAPTRTGSGYRSYSEQDVERLRFITRGRDLGFSLDEIRSLMRLDQDGDLACEDVTRLAQQHLIDVQERIRDLQRVARELERTISSCGGGVRAQCTILDALKHSPAPGEAARCASPWPSTTSRSETSPATSGASRRSSSRRASRTGLT